MISHQKLVGWKWRHWKWIVHLRKRTNGHFPDPKIRAENAETLRKAKTTGEKAEDDIRRAKRLWKIAHPWIWDNMSLWHRFHSTHYWIILVRSMDQRHWNKIKFSRRVLGRALRSRVSIARLACLIKIPSCWGVHSIPCLGRHMLKQHNFLPSTCTNYTTLLMFIFFLHLPRLLLFLLLLFSLSYPFLFPFEWLVVQ